MSDQIECLHFKLTNTVNGYSCETCDKVFDVMLTSGEYSLLLAAHNDLDVLTDKLQQENTQLKARNARLEAAIMTSYPTEECAWVGDYIKILKTVLNEAPQQSLVEIQADAIESAINNTRRDWMHGGQECRAIFILKQYAEQLRNSVKDTNK